MQEVAVRVAVEQDASLTHAFHEGRFEARRLRPHDAFAGSTRVADPNADGAHRWAVRGEVLARECMGGGKLAGAAAQGQSR
jgi:hypothetical protein